MTEQQQQKQRAIDLLESRYRGMENVCEGIDMRLRMYFEDLLEHSSAREDDPNDWHNLYELLGAAKFLRMLGTYNFNVKKVQTVIRLREGEWRQDGEGRWHHVCGGLKCPGTSGAQVYRWAPFQVFVLASVFGFYDWVNTKVGTVDKAELLPTEREKNGTIWDYRRVCTDFTYFGPRKTDKTGLAAYIQFVFFFFEDDNSEIYCCANSSDQAKLLYNRTRQLIAQMDDGNRIRSTQTVTDWRQAYKSVHNSLIMPLTAGGRTKDGLYAQLCCADEYGSAPYTNGKSDMLSLVNVVQSSMGPRREPMTFITTTAGTISAGPFIEKLDALHRTLERELTGEAPTFEDDRRLCLCLEPDEWERDEQVVLTKKSIRRKVNPMLGRIVQHSSYDSWIAEATGDSTKMPELMAKYFNVYQTGRVIKWLSGDQIRPRQTERRISDCWATQGWRVFCGLDFGGTDDLWAACYLAVNYQTQQPEGRFFADLDLWITEKALTDSPNRPLYEQWVRDGWLNVCPGEVFSHEMAVNKIMERAGYDEHGQLTATPDSQIDMRMFGYDPAQSTAPINQLKAWLQSLFQQRGMSGGDIAQIIKQMVMPVPQTFVAQNGLVQEIEYALLTDHPWLQLSANPAWPWMFQNVKLEVSPNELKKPLKSGQHNKIDGVHALLDALWLFDLSEGLIEQ